MTPSEIALTLTGSVAGWCVLALCLLVLRHMELGRGRYVMAGVWLLTALAGAWLAIVPGWTRAAPHPAVVMLATALVIVGWTNLAVVLAQATRPASNPRLAPIAVVALLTSCMAVGPVFGKEVGRASEGNTQVRLFDEQGKCPDGAMRIELWLNGKKGYDGCAVEQGDMVYIRWDDGDMGIVSRKLFKPGA